MEDFANFKKSFETFMTYLYHLLSTDNLKRSIILKCLYQYDTKDKYFIMLYLNFVTLNPNSKILIAYLP
jgi:hypothetical protein